MSNVVDMGLFKTIVFGDAMLFLEIFCYVLRSVKTMRIKAKVCIAKEGGKGPITACVMPQG